MTATAPARACGEQDSRQTANRPGQPLYYAHFQEPQKGGINHYPNRPQVYKPAKFAQCRQYNNANVPTPPPASTATAPGSQPRLEHPARDGTPAPATARSGRRSNQTGPAQHDHPRQSLRQPRNQHHPIPHHAHAPGSGLERARPRADRPGIPAQGQEPLRQLHRCGHRPAPEQCPLDFIRSQTAGPGICPRIPY